MLTKSTRLGNEILINMRMKTISSSARQQDIGEESSPMPANANSQVLSSELVRLGANPATKETAIREAAQMRVAAGRISSPQRATARRKRSLR